MRGLKAAAVAAVACGALAAPSLAGAASKTVYMGLPTQKDGAAFQKVFADADAFFPNGIKIHVGDSVKFLNHGFHTVDVPGRGGSPLPLIVTSGIVSGANDASGTPFWFNGQSAFSYNPLLAAVSLYGKTVKFTGAKRVESGIYQGNAQPKPVTVKFAKAGDFTYYCDVHPGMKGVVHVVGKSKSVPSAKADRRAVRKQVAAVYGRAKGLLKTIAPANTIKVGGSARGGAESFAFYPSNPTFPVGTTVLFQIATGSREAHTATAGPGNPETEPNSYLGQLAASFQSPTPSAQVVYPSEQPPQLGNLTPTLHGNGFWNSGVIDTDTTTPVPDRAAVKFTQAGTYTFYCLIHPFMKATVTIK